MSVWTVIFISSMSFIVFIIIGLLMYYFFARSKINQQKQKFEQLHLNLAVGQEVEFGNGLYGQLVQVGDEFCDVKVKSGAIITVSRFTISNLIQ